MSCFASSSSSSSSSSLSGPPRQIITQYSYSWYSGTCRVREQITTLPVISASQNGSGVANSRRDYFDIYGNNTWHMDERGFLTNMSFDVVTGAATQRIDDVNTAIVSGVPPGWSTPAGGGLHLVTDFTNDNLGRTTQVLGPSHTTDLSGAATTIRRATWTVYQDATSQVWTGQGYATGSGPYMYTLVNPVSMAIADRAGKSLENIQAVRASASGALQASDSFPRSSYVRWSTMQYSNGFELSSQRVYKLIPTSGTGSSGTNYDQSTFGYDVMERQNRAVTPGGTITRTVFDARGNPAAIYIGTDDTGATDSDPTGGGATGNNMVIVTAHQYDNGVAGGDNNLTRSTQYVDGSTTRATDFVFDWRDRSSGTDGEIDFYERVCFDNLDRVLLMERYDTTFAGNLLSREVTFWDDLSRVYQRTRYGVDPSTGAVGNALVDKTWYDASGRVIKQLNAGSSFFSKTVYDSLGRVGRRYQGYDLAESTYDDAGSVTNDTLFEQAETTYDNAGNVIQMVTRQRYHNATGTGVLGDPNSAQPKARVTYMAQYPDSLGRIVATADYGTNAGTSLVRSAIIPTRIDTVLVSSTQFDSTGNTTVTTDPAGTCTCFNYDAVGREVQRILNCTTASSSSYSSSSSSSGGCPSSLDTNVTIQTGYNADGNVSQVTVVNPQTGNQVTQFVYGTTLSNSAIASSLLKRQEVYPDSTSGSDLVALAYNRQGEITSKTDQLGTVHTYDRDLLGRTIHDRITALGSGVDGSVMRISTTYEVRGLVVNVTSYDNATPGSGSVVNDIQTTYNDFGQPTAEYQSHSGAVNTATTPQIQYTYAGGSGNSIRLVSMTYPNGRILNSSYGASGGDNDALSRLAGLIDSDGATHLVDYSYLGLHTFVEWDSAEPQVKGTLVGTAGGIDPDTGDIYRGLDRFGRVKNLTWYNTASSAHLEEIQHGYDRASNRVYRADPVDAGDQHDEYYVVDGLYRLHDLTRGSLTAGKDSIINPTFAECWSLDPNGNWSNFRQASTGSAWDLTQSRSHNPANEISLITTTLGTPWVTPAYNAVGNMTSVPQPASPADTYAAVFDAWNRLIKLSAGGITVSEYQYDGLNRRGVKTRYAGGILSETRHMYYSVDWRVLEERVAPSTSANRQFVWGSRYIDDLVLRDRDTTGSGSLDERLYAVQDANCNVTALVSLAGAVTERYAYAAYGMPSVLTPLFSARPSSLFDWETRFAGYRWDGETGLYHVRNRTYGPQLGCWLQRDPLGAVALVVPSDDVNTYAYVRNRPVQVIDPFGLFVQGAQGAAVAEAVATLEAGGTAAAGAAAATVAAVLAIGVVIGCGVVIQFYCRPELRTCLARATTMARQCARLACVPRGYRRRSDETECFRRYLRRFVSGCVADYTGCIYSCGFSYGIRNFSCRPNLCCDLCGEEEWGEVCCICERAATGTTLRFPTVCNLPTRVPLRECCDTICPLGFDFKTAHQGPCF